MIKEDKSGLRALAASAAGHHVQKVPQGMGHHIGNKTWDKVTQHPGKVNLNAVSDKAQSNNHYEKKTLDAAPKSGHKRFTTSSLNTGSTSTHSHERDLHVHGGLSSKPKIPGSQGSTNRRPADTGGIHAAKSNVAGYNNRAADLHRSRINAKRGVASKFNAEETEPLVEKHLGFKKLKDQLGKEKGVSDPGALAAAIGRKKYGAKGMAARAHHKEEVEIVNELSPKTLSNYIDDASFSAKHANVGAEKAKDQAIIAKPADKGKWKDEARYLHAHAAKRHAGIALAHQKLAREEVEDDLDEAKKKGLGKKVPMAPSSVSAPIKGPNQDQSGEGVDHNTAAYTISDETRPEGELTEISKALAGRYDDAAAKDFTKEASKKKFMNLTKIAKRQLGGDLAYRKIKNIGVKVPATEETIAEIITLDHIKPVQMPSPTVITTRNGAKNASSLQKTATKRDNQQMKTPTNEEAKKREAANMDKLFDNISKLTEKEQLPAFTSNLADERQMLFASWKNRKKNITGD